MDKKSFLRIGFSCLFILTIIVIAYLFFSAYGITKLTRNQIQEYIESTGAIAPLVFIGISFLQVTFVPIPGVVTILAGNYLFGPYLSFLYSYIGMIIGGVVAFSKMPNRLYEQSSMNAVKATAMLAARQLS